MIQILMLHLQDQGRSDMIQTLTHLQGRSDMILIQMHPHLERRDMIQTWITLLHDKNVMTVIQTIPLPIGIKCQVQVMDKSQPKDNPDLLLQIHQLGEKHITVTQTNLLPGGKGMILTNPQQEKLGMTVTRTNQHQEGTQRIINLTNRLPKRKGMIVTLTSHLQDRENRMTLINHHPGKGNLGVILTNHHLGKGNLGAILTNHHPGKGNLEVILTNHHLAGEESKAVVLRSRLQDGKMTGKGRRVPNRTRRLVVQKLGCPQQQKWKKKLRNLGKRKSRCFQRWDYHSFVGVVFVVVFGFVMFCSWLFDV